MFLSKNVISTTTQFQLYISFNNLLNHTLKNKRPEGLHFLFDEICFNFNTKIIFKYMI